MHKGGRLMAQHANTQRGVLPFVFCLLLSTLTGCLSPTHPPTSPGIAVNALGHGDPRWCAALAAQAQELTHTSNLFHTAPQVSRSSTRQQLGGCGVCHLISGKQE